MLGAKPGILATAGVILIASLSACGSTAVTPAPVETGVNVTPSPAPQTATTTMLPTQPTCEATIAASGLYEADIDGEVVGAPRRNGANGAGIDIDMYVEASLDGRVVPILFSIWDPDSSTGPMPTHILFGASDGSSWMVDSGQVPEMGSAMISDDGRTASFDVHLRLGTDLRGSVTCPPLPVSG